MAMIGEAIVAELRVLIKKLKYRGAMWEWAIWGRDNVPKVHFLKITFLPKPKRIRQTRLFNFSGVSLFRASSSIKRVTAFLDYCLSTRREFEKVNKVPFDEARFLIGGHEVQLFGNFPPEFCTAIPIS